MTNKEISSTTTAAKSEKNSETTLDTQEVLKETSSSKGALPSINFDVPTENIPQRQLTEEEFIKGINSLLEFTEQAKRTVQDIISVLPSKETINNFVSNLAAIVDPIINSLKEFELYVEQLKPFIEKELKKEQQKHTEIKDITVDDIATISIFNLLNVDETELEQLKKEFANNQDPVINNIDLLLDIVKRAKEAFEINKEKSLLPQISPIHPNNHLMPNNTLMNYLTQYSLINAGSAELPVLKGRGNTSHVVVGYEEDPHISAFSLTEYERQVSDSIITIWEEAEKQGIPALFTADTVFRNMPGEGGKPSPQQKGAITKAIEKFRKLHVFVNATDEMRARGLISKSQEVIFDDMYLSVTRMKCTIKNGGQTVEAYKINSEPIIYQYCKMTDQIITVPRKCIEIKKTKKNQTTGEIIISNLPVPMTTPRQAMAGYIIRRIEVMKRDRKNKKKQQSDIIRFDTLFTDVGLEEQSRDRASENRKFCYQVLDFLTAIKRIKGYEEQKKGRAITGIKILL